jgi:hypothetical protein
LGLLPALAQREPWTKEIKSLSHKLNNSGAFEYHRVATFATHIGHAPNVWGSLDVIKRRLTLPIPDPPTGHVHNWAQLTYEKNKDARTFADGAMKAVVQFVDGMLTAFEEASEAIELRRAQK